jgi:hypothetical protein
VPEFQGWQVTVAESQASGAEHGIVSARRGAWPAADEKFGKDIGCWECDCRAFEEGGEQIWEVVAMYRVVHK